MKALVISSAALMLAALTVSAPNTLSFDFKDPKGVSGLNISIDSELEPVRGHANGITGMVEFNPLKPEDSKGKIVVDAKSLVVGSEGMTGAMRQNWCLDVDKYPTFTFEISKISKVKKVKEGKWTADVVGNMTIRDKTLPIKTTVTVDHLVNKIKNRGGMEGVQGDLLTIRSKFSVNRLDFGIAPDLSTSLIGNKIDLDLAFVGVCPKQ